jgi:hypothetical protein
MERRPPRYQVSQSRRKKQQHQRMQHEPLTQPQPQAFQPDQREFTAVEISQKIDYKYLVNTLKDALKIQRHFAEDFISEAVLYSIEKNHTYVGTGKYSTLDSYHQFVLKKAKFLFISWTRKNKNRHEVNIDDFSVSSTDGGKQRLEFDIEVESPINYISDEVVQDFITEIKLHLNPVQTKVMEIWLNSDGGVLKKTLKELNISVSVYYKTLKDVKEILKIYGKTLR